MGPAFPEERKLKGAANFATWQPFLFAFAQTSGALAHLQGNVPIPTLKDDANPTKDELKARKDHEKELGAARLLLMTSVTQELETETNDISLSPFDTLKALRDKHGQLDEAAIGRLERKLNAVEHKTGANVAVVLALVKELNKPLKDAKVGMEEKKMARHVITTLGKDAHWKPSVRGYSKAISETGWSWEIFEQELIAEQALIEDENGDGNGGGGIAAAVDMQTRAGAGGNGGRFGNNGQRNGNRDRKETKDWLSSEECFGCHKKGHFARDCPDGCATCGKRGHISRDCRSGGGGNKNRNGGGLAAQVAALTKMVAAAASQDPTPAATADETTTSTSSVTSGAKVEKIDLKSGKLPADLMSMMTKYDLDINDVRNTRAPPTHHNDDQRNAHTVLLPSTGRMSLYKRAALTADVKPLPVETVVVNKSVINSNHLSQFTAASGLIDLRLDSCADRHFLTKDFAQQLRRPVTNNIAVTLGDGATKVPVDRTGDGKLRVGKTGTTITLRDANLVSKFAWNLGSVRCLTKDGYDANTGGGGLDVTFYRGGNDVDLKDQDGNVIATGTASDEDPLYKITGALPPTELSTRHTGKGGTKDGIAAMMKLRSRRLRPKTTNAGGKESAAKTEEKVKKDVMLYHRRFGHVGIARVRKSLAHQYAREGTLTIQLTRALRDATLEACETCKLLNQQRTSLPGPSIGTQKAETTETNEWLITDMGTMGVEGREGENYFQVIVDGHDKMGEVLFMKTKETEELHPQFVKHIDKIERQNGPNKPVKIIQCDGGEMTSTAFKLYFESLGIQTVVTPKGTPRRNPVAENRIKVLTNMALSYIIEGKVKLNEWPDALRAANERYNLLCSTSTQDDDAMLAGKTPFEKRHGYAPDISHLKVMFCPAYLLQRRDDIIVEREKLGRRGLKTIYHGTAPNGQGYKLRDPVTHKEYRHEYVDFDENFATAHGQGRVLTLGNGQIATDTAGNPICDTIAKQPNHEAITIAYPYVHENHTTAEVQAAPTIDPSRVHLQWEGNQRELAANSPKQEQKPASTVTLSAHTMTPRSTPAAAPRTMTLTAPAKQNDNIVNRPMNLSMIAPTRLDYALAQNTATPAPAPTSTLTHATTTAPVPTPSLPAVEQPRRSMRLSSIPTTNYSTLNSKGTTNTASAAVGEWESVSGSSGRNDANSSTNNGTHKFGAQHYRLHQRHGGHLKTTKQNRLHVIDERGMYPDEPREPISLNDLATMSPPEQKKWQTAMLEESEGLKKNKTWSLRPRRAGERPAIPGKWVFKLKRDATTGRISRYKARWVAQGFRQIKGVNYDETFAPCPRMQSFRVVCTIACAEDLDLYLDDVAQAYLQGVMEEDVVVEQPKGMREPGKEDWVCQLEKGLYGIMQGGRVWNQTLNKDMQSWGYRQSQVDPCIYTKHDENGCIIAMAVVWVDDITGGAWPLATARKGNEPTLSQRLAAKYKTTSEPLAQFCATRVERDRENRKLFLSQTALIDRMLEDYKMTDAHPVRTPMEPNLSLSTKMSPTTTDGIEEMKLKPYRALVGSLGFATMCHPEISTAVGKLARFVNNPGREHWKAAQRVLKYLKGVRDYGLLFSATGEEFTRDKDGHLCLMTPIVVYSDADYAADVDKRRSSTGYIVFMAGGVISWKHCLQQSTSLSTAEAETMSLCEATQEAEWLRNLLTDMGIRIIKPTQLWEDNQAAIALAKDARSGKRTKHIEVRHFYTRGVLRKGRAEIHYCNTKEMIADILTKALPPDQFEYLRWRMGVTTWGNRNDNCWSEMIWKSGRPEQIRMRSRNAAVCNTTRSSDTMTSGRVRIRLRHRSESRSRVRLVSRSNESCMRAH
jgi:hypothetical protein